MSMLDEADIKKLTDVLATKQDVVHISDRLAIVELKVDRMIEVLDKISLRLEMLNQEYLVLKERDSRYERWLHEIADKVGITLVP